MARRVALTLAQRRALPRPIFDASLRRIGTVQFTAGALLPWTYAGLDGALIGCAGTKREAIRALEAHAARQGPPRVEPLRPRKVYIAIKELSAGELVSYYARCLNCGWQSRSFAAQPLAVAAAKQHGLEPHPAEARITHPDPEQ